MDLYTRSATAYLNLAKVLKLPSPRQLTRYKNFVNQSPGLCAENLHWMLLEADRRGISKRGRSGFIVFDEIQIQVFIIILRCIVYV
jgi:hypothetical protein